MMRPRYLLLVLVALACPALASALPNYQGWCESGAQPVLTAGLNSTTQVQVSYPACTVSIYVHGGGLANPIYSDNVGTILANPFTAQTNGHWQFYAANGRYDITLSGAGFPLPVTYSDIPLFDTGTFVGGTVGPHLYFGNNTSSPATLAFVQPNFADLTGLLACAQTPALTGPITSSAGSCATTAAFLGFNNTFTGTNSFLASVSFKGPNPWVDPTAAAFGAVCDGTTNDSTALQAAGNFAISAGGILKLPPQTCAYATGLAFTQAVQIEGAVEQGGAGSAPVSSLKYTGTGTALSINNGTSAIYGVHLRNFLINGTVVSNQGVGIACTYCSQVELDNVFVTSTTSPGFATVYDFSNSGGVVSHSMYADNGGVAVKLVGATNVDIADCQFFQNTIAFLMGGNNVGIDVHDCPNMERQDYLVDWDDANPTATLTFGDNVNFHHNTIVFDGGSVAYPHQQVLHISNTSTNQLTLRNLIFSDNTLSCPAGTCASTYPFNIAISGTSNANTAVTLTAERNWMCCFASGGITANSTKATVAWINNQNLTSLGYPTNTDTNGTANWCVVKYAGATASFCGITVNGPVLGATTGAFSSTLSAVGITDTGAQTKVKRPYYNQGTALANIDGVLSAGWGTSPSLTVSGYDPLFVLVITAGTGTPTANPTITVTFKDGAWVNTNPICSISRGDGASGLTYWDIATTQTQAIISFIGTPVVSTQYTANIMCSGRG
jgi:hypothetical protein